MKTAVVSSSSYSLKMQNIWGDQSALAKSFCQTCAPIFGHEGSFFFHINNRGQTHAGEF